MVKIALLSVLISGVVLIAFGLFFLNVIGRVGIDRIDQEILALGESQLHVWHTKRHWEAFDRSLRSIYGQDRWQDLIVHVTGGRQQLLYKSPHWPGEITAASFPDFDTKMAGDTGAVPAGGAQLAHPADAPARTGRGRNHLRGSITRPGERPPPRPATGEFGWPPPPPRHRPGPTHIKKPVFQTLETAAGT